MEIHINSERYPKLLHKIADAPPLLYIEGNPEVLAQPQIAIVGSRNPTPAGAETAYQFAYHLAKMGLVITSGLALGIDGAAHQGALAAGGVTIAVMGTGLDEIYPKRHKALAQQIFDKGGAIVTEFPPDTGARAENFPQRNRIISGLSLGVVVVEAALRSGSLITARLATEQGREVFAIPGSIHNPLARGCHALIRQGAKLVETAADILEELGPLYCASIEFVQKVPGQQPSKPLDKEYAKLVECIGFEVTPVDTIIMRSGMGVEAVSAALTVLELQGRIAAVPGGYART